MGLGVSSRRSAGFLALNQRFAQFEHRSIHVLVTRGRRISVGKSKVVKKFGLSDPTKLKPFDKKDNLLQVIIETPKNCRNKYAFDPDQEIFALKKVLPAGMEFPYDFGFLPQTIADDGDPIDVLLLMDAPAFPGCLVKARLIGVIEGEQKESGGKTTRNDRLLAVAEANHNYQDIKKISDIPRVLLDELGEFFVNYHRLEGKKYRVIGHFSTQVALKLIKKAQKAA